MADEDAHLLPADVLITEAAHLPYAQAGGVHEGGHGLLFDVGHGGDELPDLLLGRDIGKVFIEPAHGELGIVPGLMQDVDGKEAQL